MGAFCITSKNNEPLPPNEKNTSKVDFEPKNDMISKFLRENEKIPKVINFVIPNLH